jgi:hypothetical protein
VNGQEETIVKGFNVEDVVAFSSRATKARSPELRMQSHSGPSVYLGLSRKYVETADAYWVTKYH